MFGSDILEISMGLMLIYIVLSLVCTALNELLSSMIRGRHIMLKRGVCSLLDEGRKIAVGSKNKPIADSFFCHPLIKKLGDKPSYLAPATFATVLSDLLVPVRPGQSRTVEDFRTAIEALHTESLLRRPLLIKLESAGGSLEEWQRQLENWFNDIMDRVAGWYKRMTQWIVLGLSLFVVFAVNADTLEIADSLARDRSLRKDLVKQADALVSGQGKLSEKIEEYLPGGSRAEVSDVDQVILSDEELEKQLEESLAEIKTLNKLLHSLGLPLGWEGVSWQSLDPVKKVMGLLITALAVSLGAPFWFEVLRKLANIRAAGVRPKSDR